MQSFTPWLVAAALVVIIAVLQWRVTRAVHLKHLADLRARHQRAQQSAATLVQQARLQAAQAQQALAAAREAAKRKPHLAAAQPPVSTATRESLDKLLDEAAHAQRSLPVNGFADTLPSMQFAPSTAFGLLQRSGSRSA